MRESVPTRVLIQLCQASPETLAAVEGVLAAAAACEHQEVAPASPPSRGAAGDASENTGAKCGGRRTALTENSALRPPSAVLLRRTGTPHSAFNMFRWTGRDWKVVFGGGSPFFLPDSQGARYLDYLLHHPNVPIPAFDLDRAVNPERAEARSRNSIQPESDARACGQYREALRALRSQSAKAESMGDREALEDMDGQIQMLQDALGGSSMPDEGERAYDTVRHAIRYLLKHLRGSPEEMQFGEHLRTHLSVGFECLYMQPEGGWD